MAETDIELSVKLDTKNVSSSSRELRKEIKSMFDAAEGKELNSQTQKLMANLAKLSTQSRSLAKQMQALADKKIPTDEYNNLTKEMNDLEQATAKAEDKIAKLQDAWKAAKAAGKDVTKINEAIEQAYEKADYLSNGYWNAVDALEELNKSGKAFTLGSSTQEYQNMVVKSRDLYNQMVVTVSKVREMEEPIEDSYVATSRLEGVWESLKSAVIPVLGELQTGLRITKSILDKMLAPVKKVFGALASHIKDATKATQGLNISFTKLLSYIVGISSLRMAFNKMRSAIQEGLNNLMEWNNKNNDVNRSIAALQSSLTALKNSFAAAFAPILNYIAPALVTLIDLCTSAVNAIGMLIAALSGSKTFTKATKVQQKYASALGATGKAASATHDKLAQFDDLNVLGKDGNAGSGGGGGAGGGLGDMFEEVPISDLINDWADRLKEMWAKADFSELGRIWGEKLRDALNAASDWLVAVAQPIARRLGKSLATLLIGFFETEGLGAAIGRFFGELWNTWLYFEQAFLDTLEPHARNLGRFIGDIIMTALETIDFVAWGHTLAQKFNIIFDILQGIADQWDPEVIAKAVSDFMNTAISDFHWEANGKALSDFAIDILQSLRRSLESINWMELGHGIAEFINGIDWITVAKELAGGLSALAKGLHDTLCTVLEEVDWQTIGEAIGEFLSDINWEGVIDGVFDVIIRVLNGMGGLFRGLIKRVWENEKEQARADLTEKYGGDLGKWMMEGLKNGMITAFQFILGPVGWIVMELVQAFKRLLGIASPSTVFYEIGVFLMQGLFNGISSFVDNIKQLWESIKQTAVQIWTNIKETLINIVTTIKERVTSLWTNIKNTLITLMNTLKEKVISIWNNLKESLSNILQIIKNTMENIWNSIKNTIITIVTSLKEKVVTLFNNLKQSLTNIINNIKSFMSTAWNNIKDTVVSVVTGLKNTVISVFTGLKDGIRGIINSILGFIEGLANGVIKGINFVTGALNNLSIDVPDWVTDKFGISNFGFNIPQLSSVSLPRLAQGAVIPPNKEFLAVLGDQKQGTNIEAPLDTIIDAFREVVGNMEVHNSGYSEMTVDGQTFARLMTPYIVSELKREGYNVAIMEG